MIIFISLDLLISLLEDEPKEILEIFFLIFPVLEPNGNIYIYLYIYVCVCVYPLS